MEKNACDSVNPKKTLKISKETKKQNNKASETQLQSPKAIKRNTKKTLN